MTYELQEHEALPCPFCSSSDLDPKEGFGTLYYVSCNKCDTQGPSADSKATALAQWNNRHHYSYTGGVVVTVIQPSADAITTKRIIIREGKGASEVKVNVKSNPQP